MASFRKRRGVWYTRVQWYEDGATRQTHYNVIFCRFTNNNSEFKMKFLLSTLFIPLLFLSSEGFKRG